MYSKIEEMCKYAFSFGDNCLIVPSGFAINLVKHIKK